MKAFLYFFILFFSMEINTGDKIRISFQKVREDIESLKNEMEGVKKVLLLKNNDILIIGKQALPFVKKWQKETKAKIRSRIIVAGDKLPKGRQFNLPGSHNEYNAMLAVVAARMCHVQDTKIKKALAGL